MRFDRATCRPFAVTDQGARKPSSGTFNPLRTPRSPTSRTSSVPGGRSCRPASPLAIIAEDVEAKPSTSSAAVIAKRVPADLLQDERV